MTSRQKFIRNSKHAATHSHESAQTAPLPWWAFVEYMFGRCCFSLFVMLRQWHIAVSWIRRLLGVKWNYTYTIYVAKFLARFIFVSDDIHRPKHTARRVESLIAQFKVARWSKNYANGWGVCGWLLTPAIAAERTNKIIFHGLWDALALTS